MPTSDRPQAVVAGHTALDIIPTFRRLEGGIESLLTPGKLVEVGRAVIAAGGTVPNTGVALHRLGVATRLMGKVGDDIMGRAVQDLMRASSQRLAEGMIVSAGESTSYSVVLSPPGVDRIFLHSPGANDTFEAGDINYSELEGARLFHFGYPPLMRRMYSDGGKELQSVLSRAKQHGVMVSLDMAKPDPASPAGKADWASILKLVLPHVDIFLPSIDEVLYMLDPGRFGNRTHEPHGNGSLATVDGPLLSDVARRLLDHGASIVVLKLGENGLYLRTTSERQRLASLGHALGSNVDCWVRRELLSCCFEVDAVGTTGAGDCAIAGFLSGLLKGQRPRQALTTAVAVGAFNVEQADAISGVPSWNEVQARIRSGWRRLDSAISLPQWQSTQCGVWVGPNDMGYDQK